MKEYATFVLSGINWRGEVSYSNPAARAHSISLHELLALDWWVLACAIEPAMQEGQWVRYQYVLEREVPKP